MKKIKNILAVFLLTAFATTLMGAKIGDNTLRVGDKTGADITQQMGNGRFIWSDTDQKLQFSNDAGTSIKDIGTGGGGAAGINVLENADFETGAPPTNWTASAGVFIAETVAPGFDTQSGSFDAAATSNTLDTDFNTIPLGLENRSCNATIQYKYAAGAGGDYKLQVVANTAGLIAEKDIDVSTDWRKDALQFTCPSSDSFKIRIISTLDAGIILVDNATLGRTDFVDISQTELVASAFYGNTTNCAWNVDSVGSFAAFNVDADCPAITVQSSSQTVNTADDNLPNIVFDDLKEGKYLVTATFLGVHGLAGVVNYAYQITDGTTDIAQCGRGQSTLTNRGMITCQGSVTYSSSGAKTFSLTGQELASVAGSTEIINDAAGKQLTWTVTKYPSASAEAVTLETVGWHIDANIGGANVSFSGGSQAAYTTLANAGLDMVLNPGSAPARIPCTALEDASGLTCTNDEELGIDFDVPTAGRYKVCVEFGHFIDAAASGRAEVSFQLIETPNTAETITQEGKSRVMSELGAGAGSSSRASLPNNLCGEFNFASVGKKTIRLMYEQVITGTISNQFITADRSTTKGQRDVHFTVEKMSQDFPTPAFTDLTNSLNSKFESPDGVTMHTVSVHVNATSGTPIVTTEYGNWIDSITDNGIGTHTINITSGIFSAAPICVLVIKGNIAVNNNGFGCYLDGAGPSTTQIGYESTDGAGVLSDTNCHIICNGPK